VKSTEVAGGSSCLPIQPRTACLGPLATSRQMRMFPRCGDLWRIQTLPVPYMWEHFEWWEKKHSTTCTRKGVPRALDRAAPLGSGTVRIICQRLLQPTGRFRRQSLTLVIKSMQRAQTTPRRSQIHGLLDFVISEDSLRRAMAGAHGAEEIRVGFAGFIGSTFPGMPRPDRTYYPVLAMFQLPAGRRYRTFDQYQLEAGVTTLIYPVYRTHKKSLQAVLLEQVIPACRAWLEVCQIDRKASSFYAVHDQTFDEVVLGLNKIAGACAGSCLQLAEKSRVVVSLRPGVAQL
jgi:hypothetical protein